MRLLTMQLAKWGEEFSNLDNFTNLPTKFIRDSIRSAVRTSLWDTINIERTMNNWPLSVLSTI